MPLSAGHSAPPFEVDIWPGEGVPVFQTTGRQLTLRAQPVRLGAPLPPVTLPPRQRIRFDATRYRTLKAGKFVALRDTMVSGRNLGSLQRLEKSEYYANTFPQESVPVARGSVVEYLQYRAEGTCFVRVGGKTIEADPCPSQTDSDFRLEAEPAVEWWIHVVLDSGAKGWILATDPAIKHVKREF